MIHLKTKPKPGEQQRFAILLEPEFVHNPKASPKQNDADLNAVIKEHGKAVIREWLPHRSEPEWIISNLSVELSPEQFEQEWIGD